MTEAPHPPDGDALTSALARSRAAVLAHTAERTAGRRQTALRWGGAVLVAAVVFGGGASVGAALATGTPTVSAPGATAAPLTVECFERPDSRAPFATVIMSATAETDVAPDLLCRTAWDRGQSIAILRYSAAAAQAAYQGGACGRSEGGGCGTPQPARTPPTSIPAPTSWASCSFEDHVIVEVGRNGETLAAACAAQGLKPRATSGG